MNKSTIKKYKKYHKMLLKYQDKIKPFTPTIREMAQLWNVSSTSVVKYILVQLIKLDMCITRAKGTATSYYAIER